MSLKSNLNDYVMPTLAALVCVCVCVLGVVLNWGCR